MLIKRVDIHNFRSIVDASFNCNRYNVIVGENNSGKSNIISAINAFFDSKYKINKYKDDIPKYSDIDKEYYVNVLFKYSDEEKDSLPDKYHRDDNLLLLKRNLFNGEVHAVHEDGTLFDNQFIAEKNISLNKITNIVYIPAISKIDDELKLSGPSPFRDLVQDIIKDIFSSKSPCVTELTDAFTRFQSGVKTIQGETGYSINGIIENINHELEGWNTRFDVNIEPIDADKLIKSLTNVTFYDNGLEDSSLPCNNLGSGLQRHIIYTLIKLNSQIKKEQYTKKNKNYISNTTILLFEEPEAYLHPPYQDILSKSLHQLSNDGYQIILTTHSTRFVSDSIFNIPNIIKADRSIDTTTKQLSEEELHTLFLDNTSINDILQATELDDTIEMESIKHFLWFNNARTEVFFAKNVLLVEGATELNLIKYIFLNNNIEIPKNGITVIDTMGKYNMHRFMSLLESYSIKHAVLVDKDIESKRAYKLNSLIMDYKNKYTISIDFIEHDIESFLNISVGGRPDKKPQKVLYEVIHNETDLTPLVELLNRCMMKFN